MKPLISKQYAATRHILNPDRTYVRADKTNIAETFARVRAEQAQQPSKKVRRIK